MQYKHMAPKGLMLGILNVFSLSEKKVRVREAFYLYHDLKKYYMITKFKKYSNVSTIQLKLFQFVFKIE